MSAHSDDVDTIVDRGKALYQQSLRQELEHGYYGQYLVINVDTGEYEVDQDRLAASTRAGHRFPGAPRFAMRIGYPTIGTIGARTAKKPRRFVAR